jgi:hypothetical protein
LLRWVKKIRSLSWKEQWLCLVVLCLSGVVRLGILLLPFRWLATRLGTHMQESPFQEDGVKIEEARQIGWIIEMVSPHTLWESKCLVQAIVGKILLRQRGIPNTLYLGVSTDGGSLVAHAWLRCGEAILTGGQGHHQFSIVGKFFDGGEDQKFNERR